MATDGCLISDGRHLAFGSEDKQLVETLLSCLGRHNVIQELRTRSGSPYYKVQFGDVGLYRWLQEIGLTPRKSLTLGALKVAHHMFLPLARGLMDGDGSVLHFQYAGAGKARGGVYQALRVYFHSACRGHVDWLREALRHRLRIAGSVSYVPSKLGSGVFRLSYANRESTTLLRELYADRNAPCLLRKRANWDSFLERTSIAQSRPGAGAEAPHEDHAAHEVVDEDREPESDKS